jgi:hypothetical protein
MASRDAGQRSMLGLTFTLKYQDAPHSLDGISITSM